MSAQPSPDYPGLTGTIVDVPGVRVGHGEDVERKTGCTVTLCGREGAVCGVDVRGGAPGTRETDLLDPVNLVDRVHAIVLSGGSAFGLEAATGAVRWLREQRIGLNAAGHIVPIVPAAVLFDLPFSGGRHPDQALGYFAARTASASRVVEGNVGAGCGATLGKVRGAAHAMKGGLGSASARLPGGAIVGALVAVNALGSVRDPHDGHVLAGVRDDAGVPQDAAAYLIEHGVDHAPFGTNTTLGIVATNANLTKAQAKKLASSSHDAYARTISPAHTMLDGDTIFAFSVGGVDAPLDVVGALAVDVLARAVVRAVTQATAAGGLPAHRDLRR